LQTGRKNKYGNVKKMSGDGKKFDSTWERTCYNNFTYMKLAGEISEVQCQVRYHLHVNGYSIGYYIADFVVVGKDGSETVYDAKGVLTDVFQLKRKLMKAVHGIEIVLLKQRDKGNHPWLACKVERQC
jgi:hypothetical protein